MSVHCADTQGTDDEPAVEGATPATSHGKPSATNPFTHDATTIDDLVAEDIEPNPATDEEILADAVGPFSHPTGGILPPDGDSVGIGPDDAVETEMTMDSAEIELQATAPVRSIANLPKFSWEDTGGVPPIRNQGNCGSCWAFATTAAMESNLLIRHPDLVGTSVNLAEQAMVACAVPAASGSGSGDGCGGYFTFSAIRWASRFGLPVEDDHPYNVSQKTSPECPSSFKPAFKITSARNLVANDYGFPKLATIKQKVAIHGPIVVWVWAGKKFHDHLGDGVFNDRIARPIARLHDPNRWHIVNIVGWDDTRRAFRMRNSWGTDWGDNGYAWVRYGRANLGRYAMWVGTNRAGGTVKPKPGDDGRVDKIPEMDCTGKKVGYYCSHQGYAIFGCTSTGFQTSPIYCDENTQCTPDARLTESLDAAPSCRK